MSFSQKTTFAPAISLRLITLLPKHSREIKSISISMLVLSLPHSPLQWEAVFGGYTCLALSNPRRISVFHVFSPEWSVQQYRLECKSTTTTTPSIQTLKHGEESRKFVPFGKESQWNLTTSRNQLFFRFTLRNASKSTNTTRVDLLNMNLCVFLFILLPSGYLFWVVGGYSYYKLLYQYRSEC